MVILGKHRSIYVYHKQCSTDFETNKYDITTVTMETTIAVILKPKQFDLSYSLLRYDQQRTVLCLIRILQSDLLQNFMNLLQ